MEYTVLIADDEPPVRELTKAVLEMLASDGCQLQIYEATNGTEALQTISQHVQQGRSLDLVVSDINMPGKTGVEVLIEGQKVSPQTKFILLSGRMETYRAEVEARGAKAVDKPYLSNTLLEAVKACLPQPN